MKRIKSVLAALVAAMAGAASALELLSPADNANIQLMKDAQKAFVTLSQQERYDLWNNATDDNPEGKAALAAIGEIKYSPLSVKFSWSGVNAGGEVAFTVKDLGSNKIAYTFITEESSVTLRNFEIGRTYAWTVSDGHTELTRMFTTESLVPRLMYTSHIVNWRDLGGRTGLNGKQLRQGLVYRCGQFNETSSDPEKPGAVKLDAASIKYMTEQLGIKTDVDFREDAKECAGMTGSPLGSGVRWVRTSFKGYGSFDTASSKKCFQEIFATFIDPANYPIAFHCAGGADRTGSIAFILEALLGCSEYDMELDYEVTAFSTAINSRSYLIGNFYPMKNKLWNDYAGETWAEKAASYVKACGFTDADIENFRGIMLDGYDAVERPAIAAIYPTANYLQNPDGDTTTYDYTPEATDYVWTNALGDDDWTKPGNFLLNGVVPDAVPGAADIVVLPIGVSADIDYDENDAAKKASADVFRNVKRIIPCGPRSVVRLTVPEGQVLEVNCAIVRDTASDWWKAGKISKLGAGEVKLMSYGLLKNSRKHTCDYYVALNVVDGTLTLPQDVSEIDEAYGAVVVAEGATLVVGRITKSLTYNQFPTIAGEGTIKSDNSSLIYIQKGCTFAGKLVGISLNTRGFLRLTGTESTFTSQAQLWYGNGESTPSEDYGAIGVMSFGLNGQPSSLGTAPKVVSRDNGAYVKYLGAGETTDCTLEINHKANSSDWVYLDAGETGGLNWTGNWLSDDGTFSTTKSYQHGLVIKGDGAGINTMSGKIQHHPSGSQSSVYRSTINVKKQGTGTWRINENAGNAGTAAWGMRGVWEVENGTLQFDSIAEKGVQSALGSSDELFNNTFAVTQNVENAVDYAFVLGGGVGKTRGNLEYVGSASSTAAGRAFVVDGTGAFLNNGSSALELSDFKVKSGSGDSTLVLGGANTEAGLVDRIADGDSGKLSVVKEDAGTWQLGNNLSFTGPLVVKAGKLEVGEAFKCWTFYRMVVKDTFVFSGDTGSATRHRVVGHKMVGLFDAAGNDRIYGLTDTGCLQASPPNNCNYASKVYSYVDDVLDLAPGHFLVTLYDGMRMGLSIPTPAPEGENAMTALFSHPAAGRSAQIQSRSPQSAPDYFTNSTWHVITMRPVAGEPIVSWDYVNEYCSRSYQTISNCTLEASLDGKNWTQLAEKSQNAIPTAGTWASDGTTKYAADFGTHTGMPIEPGPAGQQSLAFAGTSVSVAAGAELKFNSQVSVPKIVVEPTGMGAVTGLALAENGVIDISPAPAGNVDIPVDFTGVTLPANYSFTVNGAASTAEITLSDDKRTLSVRRRGLQIIVR